MAWEFVTKTEAAAFCGTTEDFLQDSWSAYIEQLIKDRYKDSTSSNTYTEKHDGDGTDTLFVENTPITSVTNLKFLDLTGEVINYNSSAFHVYRDYIRLDDGIFPVGKQNIEVTYTAGESTVNPRVKMAELLALSYFVKFMTGKRGDQSIRFDTAQNVGRNQFSPKPSIYRRISSIIEEVVPQRIYFD